MKKHIKRRYLRILNKILIILALILLLLLLFGFVDDLLHKMDYLIKYTDQQANHIQTLEQEVHSLETANARLENVVTYQHQQIQELRVQGNTITVDLRPNVVNVPEDIHNEVDHQLYKEEGFFNSQTIAMTIVAGLTILKGTLGLFVPVGN